MITYEIGINATRNEVTAPLQNYGSSLEGLGYQLFGMEVSRTVAPAYVRGDMVYVEFKRNKDLSGFYEFDQTVDVGASVQLVFRYRGAHIDLGGPEDATIGDGYYSYQAVQGITTSGIVMEKWAENEFYWGSETELDGAVTISGPAYELVKREVFADSNPRLRLIKTCPSGQRKIYEFELPVKDMEVNAGECKIEAKAVQTDKYTRHQDEFDKEVNVIGEVTFYTTTQIPIGNTFTGFTSPLKYERMVWIKDVLEALVDGMRTEIVGVKSTLLSVNDPNDYTYNVQTPIKDYGESSFLMLQHIRSCNHGDHEWYLNTNYSDVLTLSWNDLMHTLCHMFNAFWTIEGSYLRIEGAEYFVAQEAQGLDLIHKTKSYMVEKEDLAGLVRYRYGIAVEDDQDSPYHGWQTMLIDNGQAGEVKEVHLENVLTDYQKMVLRHDSSSDEAKESVADTLGDVYNHHQYGLFMCEDAHGTPFPIDEDVVIYNGHLGWDQLFRRYHNVWKGSSVVYFDRQVGAQGRTNTRYSQQDLEAISVQHPKPNMKINAVIDLEECCGTNYSVNNKFQIEFGTAWVTSARLNLNTGTVELSLKCRHNGFTF